MSFTGSGFYGRVFFLEQVEVDMILSLWFLRIEEQQQRGVEWKQEVGTTGSFSFKAY
jgi:hypothetical protein